MLTSNWLSKLMYRLNSPAKSRRPVRRPMSPVCAVERLEQRRLLSGSASLTGTTLTVTGDAAVNTISVTTGSDLAVVIDGVSNNFALGSVTAINISGLAGNDAITINSLEVGQTLVADGGDNNDTIVVASGVTNSVSLLGGLNDDTLTGGGGNDTLTGGAGNDTYLYDTDPISSMGSDTINESGGGTDTLDFSGTSTRTISVDLSNAAAQVVNSVLTLTLSAGNTMENVIGGSLGDTLTGNTLNNTLTGGAGNDSYMLDTDLALGSDTIVEAGGGTDTLNFSQTTTRNVAVDLSNAASQVVNAGLTLTLSSATTIENVIGGTLADTLTGNSLNNTLTGGAGNDNYVFNTNLALGSDTIVESGGGTDTLDFSATTTRNVAVNLSNGAAQVINAGLTLNLSSGSTMENVIGGTLNDALTGNTLNNVLTGGAGNDNYVYDTDLTHGSDTLVESGGGIDTLDFSGTTTRNVAIDLSNAAAQVVNAGLTLTLSSGSTMENITGGALNDTLTGNSLNNALTGGAGNDTYVFNTDLALGSDTIVESGGGTDALNFSATTARVVTVDLSNAAAQVVNAGLTLTLSSGSTMENVTGGSLGDTITGNSLANTLTGGAGNDTYLFNTNLSLGSDTVNEAGGGIDTLDFSATTTRNVAVNLSSAAAQIVNAGLTLTLSSASVMENVIGGSLNDILTGNSLNNTLTGGAGNDTYAFDTDLALGSDTINEAGGGTDTLDFGTTSTRAVAVDLSNAAAQVVNAGLTLTLSSATTLENAIGGSLNDTLTGNSQNNTLTGGIGNDAYRFNTDLALGSDTVIESAGGVDTLDFSQTTTRNVAIDLSNAVAQVVNAGLTLTLSSASTIENAIGGTLNDTFTGNSLGNTFTGGTGNDTYAFNTNLSLGSDTINEAGGGTDTLDFSATTTRNVAVNLSTAVSQIVNAGLSLNLSAGNTIENVTGGSLNDTLTGNSLNNTLTGGAGNDTFGFDTDLALGSDTINEAGGGTDALDFGATTTRSVAVNLSNAAAQVVNAGLTLTLTSASTMENVTGGALSDTITGNSLNNTLTGGTGNDTYAFNTDLALGSDTINEAGGGTDTVDFSATTTRAVAVNLSNAAAQVVNAGLTLTLSSATTMENAIGGALGDTLIGSTGSNVLTGGAGNDTLTGGAGNDTYAFNTNLTLGSDTIDESGGGTDALDFSGTTTRNVAIDLSNAVAQVVNAGLTLTLSSATTMENVTGGTLNDTLTGNSASNTLTGGAGNDTYVFDTDTALGSDVIVEAGGGTDTLDFSGTTTRSVAADLSKATLQTVNAGLTLTLSSGSTIENAIAGSAGSTLTANTLTNVFTGGAGNDTYAFNTDLALGSDTIVEAAGGIDTVDFGATTTRAISVDLSIAAAQVINAGLTLTLGSGTAIENAVGGALADTLIGNTGNNALVGFGGNDTLTGGAGNDRYVFDTDLALGSDTIVETGGATDSLDFSGTTTRNVTIDLSNAAAQVVNAGLTLTLGSGSTMEDATGGSLADTFTGNSLNNTLTGGAGNDTYKFNTDLALASDTINESGGGIDTLDFSATAVRNVVVALSTAPAQVVNAGLTLNLSSASTMENVIGGAGTDSLIGNTLNNTLTGGAGNDALTGGSGNDIYKFNTDLALGTDTISEVGGGIDTLDFSATTTRNVTVDLSTPGSQVVNAGLSLILSSNATMENVIGGALNDTLTGNALANVLFGGAGNDVLNGAAGKNILIGGTGADALTGGASEDLMLGGNYLLGTDAGALIALRTEWSSSNTYDTRMQHLLGTLAGGLNGSTALTSATAKEDGAADTLTGGGGRDWYLNNGAGAVVLNHDTVTDADIDSVFTEISSWL